MTYKILHPRWPNFGTISVLSGEIEVKMPHIPGRTEKFQLRAVVQFLEQAEFVSKMTVNIHNIGPVTIER